MVDRDALSKQIVEVLTEFGPCKAKELVRRLNPEFGGSLDTKTINSMLHGNLKTVGLVSQNNNYEWSCVGTENSRTPAPKERRDTPQPKNQSGENDVQAILKKLESAQREILDLSYRNRLINTRRSSTRTTRLEIVDELSDEVFRMLVSDDQTLKFNAVIEDEEDKSSDVFAPASITMDDSSGVSLLAKHTDDVLQTDLDQGALHNRLLKLFRDARTFHDEQGVNTLYLALGFIRFYEDEESDQERQAPLLLIPVELKRTSATSEFRIKYTDAEITTNYSLKEKLLNDFGITIPDVPDVDALTPSNYFREVREAIGNQPRWEVLPNDMVLWFFSFLKFLMWRDLKPESWPDNNPITGRGSIPGVLGSGFGGEPPLFPPEENIDRHLHPLDMTHVMDADASQTIVIEEVKRGRNLVVQGPPGTGKSQTIANMIAAAVKEGKKVLFVAEKMAALDVVMRRLSNIGLGDMCLELHSHKANKRVIIKNLEKALNLTCQQPQDVERQAEELKEYRDKLNRHADVLHRQIEPANVTPYQVFGELVRLRSSGVKPADFKMDDVVTWTSTDLKEKENLLRDLEIHLREIGNPIEHCWRGVQLGAVLPMDIDRLMTSIPGIAGRLERLMTSTAELATLLHYGTANTAMDAATLAKFAKRLARAPVMDRQSIANDIWDIRRQEIDSLIETGKQLSQSQQYLQGTVAEVAWTTDVSKARLDLSAHGKSLFRIFIKDFRQAKATLRGILDVPPPKLLKERLNLLDVLMTGQRCVQVIGNDDAGQRVGKTAFGGKWNGVNSDWQALEKIAQWESKCRKEKTPDNFREVMAKVDDLTQIGELVGAMAVDFSPLIEELQQVFGQLELDLEVAFGDREYPTVSLALIKSRLEQWTNQPETINKWIAYHQRWKKLQECGLGPVAEKIAEGAMSAAEMIDRFQMSYFEDVIRKVFDESTDLAEFQGISHQEIVNRFIDLDQQRIELSRQEVRMGHDLGMPARSGKVGEVGVITREAAKKRRHLPLRKLMDQAGNAIQAIKPVFMMSPISVAQYLKPGDLEFDVLFFDEASQVRPAEALGAIARAKQLVVVGDEKQLPPTRFFSTTIGDEHEPDEDDLDLGDLESILGLCSAQRMPDRMLRWHYRSRHESLITVSNHSFYDNRLIIIPSPSDDDGKLGLKFRNLPHGTFDRGGSRTNRIEAQAIADAVMEHVRKYPDKTLGVGAFSVAQRDEILDELEVRRRNSPELEAFFATATEEPFFVKNLENIQGDERDVIFISIGYGKDSAGRMTMNFGPLNQQGGERRLNVLITRARERCEVFSSITADDIDLSRTRAQGTHALKVFLTFAEKGHLDVPVMSGKDYDSEFERQVDKAISSQGYEVQRQVGTAGFFIDLAVIDPDKPGRYLLGIECDGASYHSSLSARDRDRLRQQVLEDRGWLIHRIWSTDWFQRPEEQLRKTLAAIEEAKVTHAGRSGPSAPPTTPPPGDNLAERIEMSSPDGEKADKDDQENNDSDSVVQSNAIQTTPYVEANFRVNSSKEIHRVPRDVLTGIVVRVVEAEGPIHKDIVAKRVAKLWGLKQIGNRISKAVDLALKSACKKDRLEQDGCFFNLKGRLARVIRNRENVAQNQKKPEHLPPAEIEFAVLTVVREHVGVSFDEIVTTVARLFGSRSTSKQLKEVITKGTLALVHAGFLEQRNDKLYTNTNHISP